METTVRMEMTMLGHDEIKEDHFWLFGDLYSVLAAFADAPDRVISRIAQGRISIPDDQANHLHQILSILVANYPNASELEIVKLASRIDGMLAERSADGELYDPTFWSNAGFIRHPDWADIREIARKFLVR